MSISMMTAVNGYGSIGGAESPAQNPMMMATTKFADLFNKADKSVEDFAFGAIDAQNVVEALSQAEMAMQTAVTVRDRVVGAYQELLRMPL